MSGIFFQPLDELRMHACVKGLSQEGMSLLVHCPQGALLGYYAEILMNSLREAMPRGTLESVNGFESETSLSVAMLISSGRTIIFLSSLKP